MKSEASEHDRLTSRVSTQAGKYLRCWCQAVKAEIPVATPWISLFQSNHWISHWSCSPTAALDLIDICLVDPLCHSSLWTVCGILSQQGIEGAIGPSTLLLSGRQYQCTNDVRVEARATPVSLYTYIDMCVCAFYFINFLPLCTRQLQMPAWTLPRDCSFKCSNHATFKAVLVSKFMDSI